MKRRSLVVLLALIALLVVSVDTEAQGRGRRGGGGGGGGGRAVAAERATGQPAEPMRMPMRLPTAPARREFAVAPILRVETGGHVGYISSMATDAASRHLVTGGADKTVRIWSLPDFELLETMRPPIGTGNEGRIDAVAMSPDGSRVAAGGATCLSFDGTACVYIFDAASGQMVKRITGFAGIIKALEWSPDGATLAVGMGGTGGLKLLRAGTWTEIGGDADYGAPITTMHFDGRGRLATGSPDGKVRVYSYDAQSLALKAKKAASDISLPGSGRGRVRTGVPRAVRFSPDGSKLAVGQSAGGNGLAVLSPDTLETLYAPTTGRTLPGMNHIAWSADGNTLYAGTQSRAPRPNVVRNWREGGRGSYTDLPAGEEGVYAMVTLKGGELVFATADQIFGIYDANGKQTAWVTPQAGQFHGGTETFKVSHDGSRIEFAYASGGQDVLNFDLHERKLSSGPAAGIAMKAAETNAGDLVFYNQWRDSNSGLRVGETALVFPRREITRSLAIAPDGRSFVVGTRFALRHYDRKGRNLWNVFTPHEVFAVNISGDGRLIVAALGDGTIRWFRRRNGRLLATLFAAPDRKRWVLASPSGFYDASVGAEDFLGWHVNRGRDEAADFFPVSRLRSRLYKPEMVAGIIAGGDDAQAFKLAATTLNANALTVIESPPDPEADEPDQAPSSMPAPASPAAASAAMAPIPPASIPAPAVAPSPSPAATAAQPAAEEPRAQAPASAAAPVAIPDTPIRPTPAPAITAAPAVPLAPQPLDDKPEAQSPERAVEQLVSDITQVLPPVVTVLSPASGSVVTSTQVTVRYSVKTAKDAPVTNVRTRIDGLSAASRNLVIAASDDAIREMTLTIPPQDTEILVFAENKHGVSMPDRIKLKWMGAAKSATETKPTLYVLAVGVSEYRKPEYHLNFAAKDATDFVNIVRQQKGKFYGDVVVKLLTDDKASAKDVIAGFEWLQKQVTPKDVGMVFIAGHGLNDDKSGYYFMPVNADLDNLEGTGVPFAQIKGHLANLAGKALLFVDTCHSGNVMGAGRKGRSLDINGVLNELSSAEYGLVVLASSTGKQFSLENPNWGNGAFTKALVEGLGGRADLKKRGRITHKMLDFYVSDRVDELTSGQQTPVNSSPQGVPDYTVAVAPN